MAFFDDLSLYGYSGEDVNKKMLNIGWLSSGKDFPKGEVQPAVIEKIKTLLREPVNPYRGVHHCGFCPPPKSKNNDSSTVSRVEECAIGNGEIRVRSKNGIIYVAPYLILHYIKMHRYLPPQEFLYAISEK